MRVTVRYFAAAREATGVEAETFDVRPGTTVSGLFAEATGRHPALAALGANLRFALAESFVGGETPLEEDATVALIPPVGGG